MFWVLNGGVLRVLNHDEGEELVRLDQEVRDELTLRIEGRALGIVPLSGIRRPPAGGRSAVVMLVSPAVVSVLLLPAPFVFMVVVPAPLAIVRVRASVPDGTGGVVVLLIVPLIPAAQEIVHGLPLLVEDLVTEPRIEVRGVRPQPSRFIGE